MKKINDRFHIEPPVGYTGKNEEMVFMAGLALSIVLSFRFFSNLQEEFNRIEILYGGRIPHAYTFPAFSELTNGIFAGFVILIVIMALFIPVYYFYHLQESKSIYLMKRLPAKNELVRRCISLPVFHITVTAITGILLYLLYLVIYLMVVPEGQLPESIF